MTWIKHKIIYNYEDNGNYCVLTEDFGMVFTKNKEDYLQTVKDGYIELEHDEYYM